MTAVLVIGALTIVCWQQVRGLGDVRLRLGAFYGWFACAFLSYLAALWLARRSERSGSLRPVASVAIVLAIAAAARLIMLGTAPTLSDDIYRYQWDGRVQLAGIDPYAHPPNHPALSFLRDEGFTRINFPHLRTIYPPLTELAFRLGAVLGPTLTAQKIIFVAAEFVTVAGLLLLLRRRGRSLLWVAAYAWHPLVILEIAGSGHNDSLGVAMLWLGVAAWESRCRLGVALGWSAAFLSKFTSVILLPWWWFRREGRRWLLICMVLAAVPFLVHPTMPSAVVESLSAMTLRVESNASLYLALAWVTQSAAAARWVSAGLFAIFLIWWARRQRDAARYVLGALGAAALLSPVLHPWYLVWLIPCFCFQRAPAFLALSGTAVLAYTVWPGRLADGRWIIPVWARVLEYAPVLLLGLWEVWRCRRR